MRSKHNIKPRYLSKIDIINAYYTWLQDLIDVNQMSKSYFFLIKDLHMKEFRWSVPNDDNRAFEGKNLREKFCDEEGVEYVDEYFDSPVSMLELIIALAYRCESIMADQNDNMSMKDWFWTMLTNAGLDKFTDDAYHKMFGKQVVDEILNRIIDRRYHRNGSGGLFPLRFCKKDQRKIELWYQMSSYLVENYYT